MSDIQPRIQTETGKIEPPPEKGKEKKTEPMEVSVADEDDAEVEHEVEAVIDSRVRKVRTRDVFRCCPHSPCREKRNIW